MGAVIQDGAGNYYYVTMGAAEDGGLIKMMSEGVQGSMAVIKIEGANSMDEAVSIATMSDPSNSLYTDHVTFKTDSETDQIIFDEITKKSDAINSGSQEYNVLSNNCTDAIERPIEEATGVSFPDGARPNKNFKEVKNNQETIQKNITSNKRKIDNVKVKTEESLVKKTKDNTDVQFDSNPKLDLK